MNRFVILIILLSLPGSSFSQENLKIKTIRFEGNKAFNKARLKEQITLQTSSYCKEKLLKKEPVTFSRTILDDDIHRLKIFYQKEGYLNVKFTKPQITISKKNKVHLTIKIIENQPITVKSIEYEADSIKTLDQILPNKELKTLRLQSHLRPNAIFRDEWCISDQQLINNQFNNIGYAFSQCDFKIIVDTISSLAKIKWIIHKGNLTRFGKTTITGNNKVPEQKIRRQLTYKEGDIWSKEDINLTQKRIYNLGMFRVSSLNTISNKARPDTIPMQINLKEAPRWTTRFGVGYGREDKFRVFGELQKLGIVTKTGRINLYTKHSALEPYMFVLKFTQPAIAFPINSVNVIPYIQKKNEPGYTIKTKGFKLMFLQNFSDRFNTNITFFYEDVNQDTSNYFSSDEITYSLKPSYLKAGISLGFAYFNGEPKLNPINGHALSLNIKTNGFTTGEMPFYRGLIEYKKYTGINYWLTLAFKGKVGVSHVTNDSDYLPPEERFYAGGAHSVRGWMRSRLGPKDTNDRPIGGKSLFESNIEARIKLTTKLIIAGFMDAGNVWKPSFYYRVNELNYAAGTGIRYDTPIGPAGIDFARPVFNKCKSWQIHFNIGHPF